MMGSWELRPAQSGDLDWIYRLRHDVYAEELGQHAPNPDGRLSDALDGHNVYLVAVLDGRRAGFVSITPPWAGRYGIEKYVTRGDHVELMSDDLFEIRILTVEARYRRTAAAGLLMYAALRWISSHGGRHVVAMGRASLLGMYLSTGLTAVGRTIRSGAVDFELLHGEVRGMLARTVARRGDLLRRLEGQVRWDLEVPFLPADDLCEHGGTSFEAIGRDFATLDRRDQVVTADVLDAWFPPAPGVVAALAQDPGWLARTSPPAGAEGLISRLADAREVPVEALAVGSGSSDLIFRAMRGWLTGRSRALLLDPTYGEYAHVLERVVGARVERLRLTRENGWRIDPDRLRAAVASGPDLVVLVNPNNPTGRYFPPGTLEEIMDGAPPQTRFWIDEAYLEYVPGARSLESYAATSPRTVVCKSLSKVYALSGLRAAYLVGPGPVVADLRRWTPPWQVGLPAQVAAVHALADPAYYRERWAQTARLRADLVDGLRSVDPALDVDPSLANSLLVTVPSGGPTASAVVRACRQQGVFLRDLTSMSPAFGGRTLRVAVKDGATNERILKALREALAPARTGRSEVRAR